MPGTLGWDDDLAAAFAPFADTHLAARVARVDRRAVDLIRPGWGTTPRRASIHAARFAPAVGDWVAVVQRDHAGDSWDVDALLPRRTAIQRADPSGRSQAQVLAANIDVVLIAVPVVPEPKVALVERMVALAWDSGADPVVVVTKADITPESGAIAADLAEAAPGADVVAVSVVVDGGLAALAPYLAEGRTLCLLGRSGAGKSSLVNALAGTDVLATREIRGDGKGRHTTTHRELIVLPTGRSSSTRRAYAGPACGCPRMASTARSRTSTSSLRIAGSPTAPTTANRDARSWQRWKRGVCPSAGWSRGESCSGRRDGWPCAMTPGCAPRRAVSG